MRMANTTKATTLIDRTRPKFVHICALPRRPRGVKEEIGCAILAHLLVRRVPSEPNARDDHEQEGHTEDCTRRAELAGHVAEERQTVSADVVREAVRCLARLQRAEHDREDHERHDADR